MTSLAGHLPALPLALLLVGLFAALALGTVLGVRRFCPWLQFAQATAGLGQIFGTAIGTLFALVFAMVTMAVWENYDRAVLGVAAEANCLGNLYHQLDAYPAAVAGPAPSSSSLWDTAVSSSSSSSSPLLLSGTGPLIATAPYP